MRTPDRYKQSLKAGIISEEMLSDCQYSVNKRAKNYRDKARESKWRYGRRSPGIDDATDQKERYYQMKDYMLAWLEPVGIHQEFAGYHRQRIYDYEEDYRKYKGRYVWENCYWSEEEDREIWFGDYEDQSQPEYRYYLYYQLGSHSFHQPINKEFLRLYENLPCKKLNDFETFGAETGHLVSMQFVNRVMYGLASGTAHLQSENTAEKVPSLKEIPSFIKVPEERTRQEEPAFEKPDHVITTVCGFYGDEFDLKDFIGKLVRKDDTLAYAKEHGMEVKSKTTMTAALQYLQDQDLLFAFAQKQGVGVVKRNYTEAGMSESMYRRLMKKMKVVGKYRFKHGFKNEINEYDLRQYLKWRNTGEL